MMMKLSSTALLLVLSSSIVSSIVDAATHVAVLEFGKGGSVRRTAAADGAGVASYTSVEGVNSFWNALHRNRRSLQHSGMPFVADLFHKADTGLVVGLSGNGVDLDQMPFVSSLLLNSNNNGASSAVVGTMQVDGQKCKNLLSKLSDVETIDSSSSLEKSCHKKASVNGFAGIQTTVGDPERATQIDEEMSSLVQELHSLAESSKKTIVLHLVVEEEEGSSRRRLLSRRLEDERDGEQQNNNNNNQQQQNNGQEGEQNNNANANGQQYSGYYGYGYYNAYGEWVTPYRTMFQIQYFNVVLWTALGLVFALFFVIYLMIYMPLEPDTLLFGESAKMVGSE